jgi:hypothetical protein
MIRSSNSVEKNMRNQQPVCKAFPHIQSSVHTDEIVSSSNMTLNTQVITIDLLSYDLAIYQIFKLYIHFKLLSNK